MKWQKITKQWNAKCDLCFKNTKIKTRGWGNHKHFETDNGWHESKKKNQHQGTHACMIYTYIHLYHLYIYIHSLCASNINLSFSLNSYPVRLVDLQCDRESWVEAQSLGPKLPAKIGDDGAVILLLYHPIVFSLNQQHPLLMHNF